MEGVNGSLASSSIFGLQADLQEEKGVAGDHCSGFVPPLPSPPLPLPLPPGTFCVPGWSPTIKPVQQDIIRRRSTVMNRRFPLGKPSMITISNLLLTSKVHV